MTYTVSALAAGLPFAAEVRGLAQGDLTRPEVVKDLNRIWVESGLLLFRDVESSPQFQIELSRCFGKLEAHPARELWLEGSPELISVTSKPEAGTIVSVNGQQMAGWTPWHCDTIYTPQLSRGGILKVTQATSWGGETCFLDQIEAYNTLPSRLKDLVDDMEIVYQMQSPAASLYARRLGVEILRPSNSMTALLSRIDQDFPAVVHPAVYVQPGTGRRVLKLSPHFAQYILGRSVEESEQILGELVDHITSQSQYKHKWQGDEMILWDNWRMLHSVTGCPINEVRTMRRTTIGGTEVSGRHLTEQAAS